MGEFADPFVQEDYGDAAASSVPEVSSAVDFDHELDSYIPQKDHYNFYFTYKIVHPWWEASELHVMKTGPEHPDCILEACQKLI